MAHGVALRVLVRTDYSIRRPFCILDLVETTTKVA
jgi:hypothetical protein